MNQMDKDNASKKTMINKIKIQKGNPNSTPKENETSTTGEQNSKGFSFTNPKNYTYKYEAI